MTDIVQRLRGLAPSILAMRDGANEIERLRSEVEALRADAERYRWLRQERYMFREGAAITCDEQAETAALWIKCPVYNDAAEVDAAIDAAREGK